MNRFVLFALAATGLSLAACASLSPYGAQSKPGGQGYTEQRIEADRYRVTYYGVGNAGPVSDYALRRAAELTTAEGYDWFEVTQRWIDGYPDGGGGVRPTVGVGYGASDYGGWSSSGVGVGIGFDMSGPQPTSTSLEIVMGRGSRPDSPNAYDARSVQELLRPQ